MKAESKTYLFKKSGFKKRQSTTLKDSNTRHAFLIDAHIVNESKIMMIHDEKDFTLFPLFIHILSKLDLETETWEVREDEFKSWFLGTFKVNNRFDIQKRIQWLSNAGLIEFQCTPNELLMTSKQAPNDILKDKQTPLGMPETLVALRATKPTNQPTNQPTEVYFSGFEKFWENYPSYENRKAKKAECFKRWKSRNLESMSERILLSLESYKATESWTKDNGKYIQAPLTFINNSSWDVEISIPKQPKTQSEEAQDKLKQMLQFKQWRSYWNKDDIIQTAELQRLSDRSVFHQKHGPIDVSNLSSWVAVEEDVAV